MDIQIGQVLTQIVAFLIMLWVLKKFAWKPVLDVLEARQQKIVDEFKELDSMQKAADASKAEWQEKIRGIEHEARIKIQDAVNQGQLLQKEIEEEANAEARQIVDKARVDAQEEYLASLKNLREQIVRMAISATEKIIDEKMNPAEQDKLVDKFIHDVEWK